MTNAVLPLDRPKRSVSLHPMVALTAIWAGVSAGMLTVVHGLDYWLFSANLPTPRNAEELLAMADRLSEGQPGYAADLRDAAARSKGSEVR